MSNRLPNEFKGKGKTGRFWLSPYHLMEAKHNLEIKHAKVKRGERGPLKDFKHRAWSCGCCVDVLEIPRKEPFDYEQFQREHTGRVYQKAKRRTVSYLEIQGRRVKTPR